MKEFEDRLNEAAKAWDEIYSEDNKFAFIGGAYWIKEQPLLDRMTILEKYKFEEYYNNSSDETKEVLNKIFKI